MLAILTGNFVKGFKAYEVPDDETTIKFFLGRVPESRLVTVYAYDDLMTEYNSPAAESGVPQSDEGEELFSTEIPHGDGAAIDGSEGPASGDSAGAEDGITEQSGEAAGQA